MRTPTQTADAALAEYAVLDAPPDDALQSVVELAAIVCDVPNAAITLITHDHQHQVAAVGIDPSVCSREDSMCAAVLHEPGTVVSGDARNDARFAHNPFVTGVLASVRFYASAPSSRPPGRRSGACASSTTSRTS